MRRHLDAKNRLCLPSIGLSAPHIWSSSPNLSLSCIQKVSRDEAKLTPHLSLTNPIFLNSVSASLLGSKWLKEEPDVPPSLARLLDI